MKFIIVMSVVLSLGCNNNLHKNGFSHQAIPNVGMDNLGNTCFANSSINFVLSASVVEKSLNKTLTRLDNEEQEHFLARKEFHRALKALSLARQKGTKVCNELSAFFRAYEKTRKIIKGSKRVGSVDKIGREQADAHEFLSDVLEFLAVDGPELFAVLDFVDGSKKVLKPSSEKMLSIQLAGYSTSIQELYNNFFSTELMTGDNQVRNNEDVAMDSKRRQVLKDPAPSSLILSLKRFSYDFDTQQSIRLSDEVSFDATLNITTTSEKNLSKTINHSYAIKSIIIHQGSSPRGGHYYAYVFDKTLKRWVKFNDSSVSFVEQDEVKEDALRNGYVYLFEKRV